MARLSGTQRTIALIGVTAVVALGAGIGLSRFIISPAEAAAEAAPPEAGPITVPVEERTLANDVVIRGDATYEGATEVTLEAGEGSAMIVTGKVPEAGSTVDAGEVLLEVTGRPVIVLEGDLPVYRSLRAGSEGPDVVQLKKALKKLGLFEGGTKNDTYGASTAAAVRALYDSIGYEPPSAGPEAEEGLRAARDAVRGARESIAAIEAELVEARRGPSKTELRSAEFELDEARAELRRAKRSGTKAEVRAAEFRVEMARLALAELKKPRDTSAIRATLDAAREALRDAQSDLAEAQDAVLTPLPASEVVFLPSTPRRVDDVLVQRGNRVEGPVMVVSGADLQIKGSTSAVDAALLSEGQGVLVDLPGGEEVAGEILSIGEPEGAGAGARVPVTIVPLDLTDEQVGMLQGANVRVRIPVSSTGGDVLAVPIAALTAGPGGEDRVELWDPASQTSTLVQVRTGLAAGGFVEVEPVDGTLAVGDLVVVGIEAARSAAATAEDDAPESPSDDASEDSGDATAEEGEG